MQTAYVNSWKSVLEASNKLRTYRLFKREFKLENYLVFMNSKDRLSFTKFRISSHNLKIETGRHSRPPIPADQRYCSFCTNSVEDEFHVIMVCPRYHFIRNHVFNTIDRICDTSCLNPNEKFLYLMKTCGMYKEVGKTFSKLINSVMNSGGGEYGVGTIVH